MGVVGCGGKKTTSNPPTPAVPGTAVVLDGTQDGPPTHLGSAPLGHAGSRSVPPFLTLVLIIGRPGADVKAIRGRGQINKTGSSLNKTGSSLQITVFFCNL